METIHISTENQYLTLINVFSVAPPDQNKLIDLLSLATQETVNGVDGFISASLHRSLDGHKVTMYSQWSSLDAYLSMRKNPQASPYLEQALAMATFDPGIYELVKTFLPKG